MDFKKIKKQLKNLEIYNIKDETSILELYNILKGLSDLIFDAKMDTTNWIDYLTLYFVFKERLNKIDKSDNEINEKMDKMDKKLIPIFNEKLKRLEELRIDIKKLKKSFLIDDNQTKNKSKYKKDIKKSNSVGIGFVKDLKK